MLLPIVQLVVTACFMGQVVASSHHAVAKSNLSICLLPQEEGDCRGQIPHYFYDRYTQTCQEFLYGGCGGNANNFETLEDCEKTCWKIKKVPKPCRMEAKTGRCRALVRRYAYNLVTMKCEQFIYGGCDGTDNNFESQAACMKVCAPQRHAPSFCYSRKDEGSCSASVTRYYFNIDSKSCEQFQYSGCGGNSNNFITLEDCKNVCKKGNKKPRNRNRIRRP